MLYQYPELKLVESEEASLPISQVFKYRPGLLFLREAPILIEAYERLREKLDFLIVNGHGLAHPFGFGLARAMELTLDVPCIGCAQEPLIGKYEKFERKRGNFSYLKWEGKTLGLAISTRNACKPLIVSSAGKLSLSKIKEIILLTTQQSKLPLPLREADRVAKTLLSQKEKAS